MTIVWPTRLASHNFCSTVILQLPSSTWWIALTHCVMMHSSNLIRMLLGMGNRINLLYNVFTGTLNPAQSSHKNSFWCSLFRNKFVRRPNRNSWAQSKKAVYVMFVQDIVRWCCRTGYVSVNSRDNAGYTPLHGCCIGGHLHIARCLIEYGADVNAASRLDGARSALPFYLLPIVSFLYELVLVLWCCWFGSRKGVRPVKTEWWDAGMVMCLGQGADLHMTQLMPLHSVIIHVM